MEMVSSTLTSRLEGLIASKESNSRVEDEMAPEAISGDEPAEGNERKQAQG